MVPLTAGPYLPCYLFVLRDVLQDAQGTQCTAAHEQGWAGGWWQPWDDAGGGLPARFKQPPPTSLASQHAIRLALFVCVGQTWCINSSRTWVGGCVCGGGGQVITVVTSNGLSMSGEAQEGL